VTTIFLADDHQVVRQGLKALLEAEPGFTVVGEAADGLEALAGVERLKPEVVVMDLVMPGLGGLDVTREALKRSPGSRVVVLSMHASEAYLVEALRNGASAYVVKDAGADELTWAIREAAAGRRYLGAPFSRVGLAVYLKKAAEAAKDPYESLTPREREVLHLTAEGLTSAGIAARLHMSPRTAETHRASILKKLGKNTRAELIRYALRRGVIPMEEGRGPVSGIAAPRPRSRRTAPRGGPSRKRSSRPAI